MQFSFTPSKEYKLEYAEMARQLALLFGANHDQIAKALGVSKELFEEWVDTYPELQGALFVGNALADARVADSLYRRACGYEHTATKFFKMGSAQSGSERIESVTYTERYPPDTGAGTFWLRNRQPQVWKDQINQALTDADGNPLTPPTIVIQPVATKPVTDGGAS